MSSFSVSNELTDTVQNEDSNLPRKKIKIVMEDLGYGPGNEIPPKERPNLGGNNQEADDLI